MAFAAAVMIEGAEHDSKSNSGVANPHVIDLFAHDSKTDQLLLVMNEARPWDGSDERLHELQEKFNAYTSFLLDGEMAEHHPELVGKLARIELRCADLPDNRTIEFLNLIHEQLSFQDIGMEVVVLEAASCGHGCGCHGDEQQG